MSNIEQFEKAVTDAGAVAMRILRGPRGSERLVIQTPGGLIGRCGRRLAISLRCARRRNWRSM